MTVPWGVLVVSSDVESRRALATILNRQGIEPICGSTIADCRGILAAENLGLVFCDSHLADGDYSDLLRFARSLKSKSRIVITSPHGEWDEYLQAVRMGAFDVIASPCRPTDVEWMVIQAKREDRTRARQEVSINLQAPLAQQGALGH